MNADDSSEATPPPRDVTLFGLRVLLVDDDDAVRETQRRLLELDQHISIVGEADTGEEALKLLETTKVDVVTLDLLLPGISGIETIFQIKSLYPDIKIVVLSAYGGDLMERSVKAGADGYVLKPYAANTLVERIRAVSVGNPRSLLP